MLHPESVKSRQTLKRSLRIEEVMDTDAMNFRGDVPVDDGLSTPDSAKSGGKTKSWGSPKRLLERVKTMTQAKDKGTPARQ